MKKSVKIWLVTAASCVVLGTAIIGGIFAMAKGDITKFLTQKMETNEHKLSAEFSEITLITNTADVEIIPTDKDYAYVVCREMEKQKHTVKVNEGKLLIEVEDTRKWYDHIGVIFENSAISVYLPRQDYGDISVKADTGTVKISEAFKFKGINVEGSTCTVTCFASVEEQINIEVTTGDVKIVGVSAGRIDASASTGDVSLEKVSCSGELSVSVSTGSVSANNVTCKSFVTTGTTGDVNMSNVVAEEMLSLDVHTGSISFDGCDAAEIRMTTSTGDVKGSLLSGKIFTVKTETGSIDVPDSTGGGSCKVTTTTGSIKIKIK